MINFESEASGVQKKDNESRGSDSCPTHGAQWNKSYFLMQKNFRDFFHHLWNTKNAGSHSLIDHENVGNFRENVPGCAKLFCWAQRSSSRNWRRWELKINLKNAWRMKQYTKWKWAYLSVACWQITFFSKCSPWLYYIMKRKEKTGIKGLHYRCISGENKKKQNVSLSLVHQLVLEAMEKRRLPLFVLEHIQGSLAQFRNTVTYLQLPEPYWKLQLPTRMQRP